MRLPSLSLPSASPADITDRLVDYLVDTPEGPVGILDGFQRDERGRPMTLIVSQGWFGRRRLLVPIEQLAEIDHARKRIILAPGAAAVEHKGPLMRLIDRGESPCPSDDPEETLDDAGWSATKRNRDLGDLVPADDPAGPDPERLVATPAHTDDEFSPCPTCGRVTRTIRRGACADCWQSKTPDGKSVFRPMGRLS